MSLPKINQGSRYIGLRIRWWVGRGIGRTALDLTGSTITGVIVQNGVKRVISGTMAPEVGTEGWFRWTFSAEDVGTIVPSDSEVQFKATFPSGLYELADIEKWGTVAAK